MSEDDIFSPMPMDTLPEGSDEKAFAEERLRHLEERNA
jgi:hypothetical protein